MSARRTRYALLIETDDTILDNMTVEYVGDDRKLAIEQLKDYVREEEATIRTGIKKVTLINTLEASDQARYMGWVDFTTPDSTAGLPS